MPTIPTGEWQLECTGEVFQDIRTDREFAFLVSLARIVNALKFGVSSHRLAAEELTPAAERQRVGSTFYLAGVLHEVLEFKSAAAERWDDLKSFRDVFATLDDSSVDEGTADILRRIRNRAAFHFDPAVAEKNVPQLPAEPFTFLAATGKDPFESNYELADLITFGFIFAAPADAAKLNAGLRPFRSKLDELLLKFIRTADRVLVTRLLERGFTILARPDGSFRADRMDEGVQSSDDV